MTVKKASERVPRTPFLKVGRVLIISVLMIMAVAISARSVIVEKPPVIIATGTVSDSLCGADHGNKTAADAVCTRTCVELGGQYALVVGKKVYVLLGSQADLDRFAGSPVRVKGRAVSRDTILVDQVTRWYSEAASGMQ